MTFPTGCYYFPQETAAYVLQRRADGIPCDVGQLGVDGAWQRLVERGAYGVFAGEVERELRGEESPVRSQNRGTCCVQGSTGALQDSVAYRIHAAGAVGAEKIDLAAELLYGIGRSITGRGHYVPARGDGNKDGLAVVHAAMGLRRFGALRRGIYGDIDISVPREEWAVEWADTGRMPQALFDACRPVEACQKVETARELADVNAAGYFASMGTTWEFMNVRDQNGMCGYRRGTAHCEQTAGCFLLPSWDGNPATCYQHTGIVRRQSWNGIPTGPDVLRYYGGKTYKLRKGEYGITLRDAYQALLTMETWCFSPPEELWREAA